MERKTLMKINRPKTDYLNIGQNSGMNRFESKHMFGGVIVCVCGGTVLYMCVGGGAEIYEG